MANELALLIQEEYDTHDPKGYCTLSLPFLKKRSKIIEIVAARDIVFALAQSGVCAAFSRGAESLIYFFFISIVIWVSYYNLFVLKKYLHIITFSFQRLIRGYAS